MAWFRRSKENIQTSSSRLDVPEGMWIKCPDCGNVMHRKKLEQNLYTCESCNYHFRIGSEEYFNILMDEGTFRETDRKVRSVDPLNFSDTEPYKKRLDDTMKKTGLYDSVRTGTGKMDKKDVVIGAMDFSFIGGSMGSVVGEKIARAIDRSIKNKAPLILITSSGGARMQEGCISLMQLAKISTRLAKLSEEGIPYITLLTNPSFGGITASFGMLGDVIVAEPNAKIGFAGPRVIKQFTGKDLPEGFQTSEFIMEHGFIDFVVDRKQLKEKLSTFLKLVC